MPRHIAIYKRYDTDIGLQQGKDYHIISEKSGKNGITVKVISKTEILVEPIMYSSDWEFLQDWQILRTWKGK